MKLLKLLLRFPSHWLSALATYKNPEKKRRFERQLRGCREERQLRHADWVLVSWGKSGRTWFRVMFSHYCKVQFGLLGNQLILYSNLHYQKKAIPKVLFTHDNYLRSYTKNPDNLKDFYDSKVILMVRDPRDVIVSQYFHWRYRAKLHKKILNQYPLKDTGMFEFVLHEHQGLTRIIDWMNLWARELPNIQNSVLLRYEDLRSDTEQQFTAILDFIDMPYTEAVIKEATQYADFQNMKKREQGQASPAQFFDSGTKRLNPADPNNQDSYKTRKGKVGGFRDYFDAEQVAQIDNMMTQLDPIYGYSADSSGSGA